MTDVTSTHECFIPTACILKQEDNIEKPISEGEIRMIKKASVVKRLCRRRFRWASSELGDMWLLRECSLFTWGGRKNLNSKLHTLCGTKITEPPFFTDKRYYPPGPRSTIPVMMQVSGDGKLLTLLFARKSYTPPLSTNTKVASPPPPPDFSRPLT